MIFKDKEFLEILNTINKKLDTIIAMKKAEKIKSTNKKTF